MKLRTRNRAVSPAGEAILQQVEDTLKELNKNVMRVQSLVEELRETEPERQDRDNTTDWGATES